MDAKYEVLRHYFGYTEFRSGQETLIDALLAGRDALGVLPTGGGKSLCYQIPALLLNGVTLVVSPLISLMKDQVAALKSAGVAAAYINSSLTRAQTRIVYRRCREGAYRIIYVAPERLMTEEFLAVARELHVGLLAVDEAHCISQWGQDFRPSYLQIADFLDCLPQRPAVGAFTATATAQVREDIVRALRLENPVSVVTGFDRPNLRFEVRRPGNKQSELLRLLDSRREDSGIVYCGTRKDVEAVCTLLQDAGFSATRYHAGLPEAERRSSQEDFTFDRRRIMVATNAFGMGIDKSNVSFVIHYNMPGSLEAYYQEAGRAGRDGSPADCILLFSDADVRLARLLIRESGSSEDMTEEEQEAVRRSDWLRLRAMIRYCRTADCLRGCILDYFGQEHGTHCGNCSSCDLETAEEDLTTAAQMILSCVKRMRDFLGYPLGAAMVIRVLRGSGDKRLKELRLDSLPTYGLMRDRSREQVSELMWLLEDRGYLYTEPEYETVRLTERAAEVLFRGEQVWARLYTGAAQKEKQRKQSGTAEGDSAVFRALKALRLQLAREEQVPAYVVFTNATLADMAQKLPRNREELLDVAGVGERKAERYGEAFLTELRRLTEHRETESQETGEEQP